jgi:hypothetical protein
MLFPLMETVKSIKLDIGCIFGNNRFGSEAQAWVKRACRYLAGRALLRLPTGRSRGELPRQGLAVGIQNPVPGVNLEPALLWTNTERAGPKATHPA